MLDEKGIKVTSARFLVEGQTYAVGGITSVMKTVGEPPSKLGPIVTIVLGAVGLFNGAATAIIGLMVVVVGVLWFRSRRTEHVVVLTTAAGEKRAYKSADEDFVDSVVVALNDAIVHRG